MGILAAPLAQAVGGRGPLDDYWYQSTPTMSSSGVQIGPESVMTLSTFYAGVTYISEDVAKIPLNMFEDLGKAGHRAAPEHYLQAKLHDTPNRYQGALEFREMMTAFAMLRRYGIAEIRPGRRPLLDDEWVPLHPGLVRDETLRGGVRRYQYRDPLQNFQERELRDDQVVILRGRLGKSVIDFARDSAGLGLAQERNAANLFARGAKFQGAILRDKPWSNTERRNFRKALNEYTVEGQYSGRPLLLEDGMKWQDVGMKASDAEFLDSRRFSVVEACRWFRIPPHKLFELERATNNNIERQSVDYVVDSLLGWTERWDQTIFRDLIPITQRERFFAEHNLDGLLKGDIKARYEAYALAIQWGFMTRNEVREKENLNPIKGGELAERPLNMEPIGTPSAITPLVRGRVKLHAADAAARVVRREIASVGKLAEKAGTDEGALRTALEAFYAEHVEHVAGQVHIAGHEALRYCQEHRDAVLAGGTGVMDDWLVEGAESLTNLAIMELEIAA